MLRIEDRSPFVSEQHASAARGRWPQLRRPEERVCPVADPATARRLGVVAMERA
jgi:hypothetical protein